MRNPNEDLKTIEELCYFDEEVCNFQSEVELAVNVGVYSTNIGELISNILPWYIHQYLQMQELLNEIEWNYNPDHAESYCPCCGSERWLGHSKDCALDKLLLHKKKRA